MVELEWTVSSSDASWMWFGMDPRTGIDRDGDFRTYLMHEFGHWVVAQEQEPRMDVIGLGLYGLEIDGQDRVRVGKGGGIRFNFSLAGDREAVTVNTAGVVAEKLAEDEAFAFDDPLGIFGADSTFDNDYAQAEEHLARIGILRTDAARFERALRTAMEESSRIIRPLLPRLREQVLRLERIVVERALPTLEIRWSGVHAALLTGNPVHDYEVDLE